MTRASWKAVEREIAARLGGTRVPITGRIRGYAPDVEHPHLAIEVKSRKNLPALLVSAMDQAVAAAGWALKRTGATRMPLVVIHKDNAPYAKSLAVLWLSDFEKLARLPGGPMEGGSEAGHRR